MSIREEQCNKVCRILDDVLANRPTERDSLIVAVRKAFEALELFGISEQLPPAQPERKTGKWELLPLSTITPVYKCSACGRLAVWITTGCLVNRHYESYLSDFCPSCGADMRG